MIYIVTGDGPRCGSVMMMRSLEAGGMTLAYDPRCDKQADMQADEDYHPNPEGLYEFQITDMMRNDFPIKHEGKAVKVFPPPWGPLTRLPEHEYMVVWLHRDMMVRWRSFCRFHANHPLEMTSNTTGILQAALRDYAAEASLHMIAGRKDMKLICVDYDLVVENPFLVFNALKEAGWPIDPEKAATIPDRKLRRFLKEA